VSLRFPSGRASQVGGGELSLENVWRSNSATPIRISGGSEVQLTVRIDPRCANAMEGTSPTREALAAAIYLRRTNGSTLAIVTDGSWGWRSRTCVTCQPGDGPPVPPELWAYNSSFSTEERVPPGATWLTHSGGNDAARTTWRTLVKRLPAGVCNGIDPVPVGSLVAAAPPPDDRWPAASRAVSSVLGILLALVTGLVASTGRAIRRERRRVYGPWGKEEWADGVLPADGWERPPAVGPPDAIGGALWDPTAAAAAAPPVVAAAPSRGEWRRTSSATAPQSEPTDTLTSSGGEAGEEALGTSSSLGAATASGFADPPLMPEGLAGSVDGLAPGVPDGEGAP